MTTETLQRVYAHHHPDHLRDPAEALSGRPRNVRATRRNSTGFRTKRHKKRNEITGFRVALSSPKAEATGSNPVGRANIINDLARKFLSVLLPSKRIANRKRGWELTLSGDAGSA